jgi:hypothetical protein
MNSKWSCPQCPMTSTRRWNVLRHIGTYHRSMSQPVSPYEKSNPAYQTFRESAPFQYPNTIFDTASYSPDPRGPNPLQTQYLDNTISVLKKQVEVKDLLNQLLLPNPTISRYSSTPYSKHNYSQNGEPFDVEVSTILGYEGYVCNKCLIGYCREVHCNKQGELLQTVHKCDPENVRSLKDDSLKKSSSQPRCDLINEMKRAIKKWIDPVSIYADKVGPVMIDAHFTRLDITDLNHWALCSITNKTNNLSDQELADFLINSQYNTYGFYDIHLLHHKQDISLGKYLIFLSKRKPITPLYNKDDENGTIKNESAKASTSSTSIS